MDAKWGPRLRKSQSEKPPTLASRTMEALRRDIISNQHHPGERLTFDKLSKHYGVGVSPLREALFQLAGEGLVVAEDHKGFVVAPINIDEMLDVSSLRAELETLAIRLSIAHGTVDWETRVVAAHHRLKRVSGELSTMEHETPEAQSTWEQCHRDIHYSLCSACGSPWLLHFIDTLFDHLERYRRYFWRYGDRAASADKEHEEIVEVALARDTERAVALLTAHFSRQAQTTLDVYTASHAADQARTGSAA